MFKNIVENIAKEFDLKLYEKFHLVENNGDVGILQYRFSRDGLEFLNPFSKRWIGNTVTINNLLNGKYGVKKYEGSF